MLAKQGGVCPLCKRKVDSPCVDHDHDDGYIRAVLCRGCNALLGKIENARRICKLADISTLARFLSNVVPYLHNIKTNLLHPTHRTDDEKRLLKNKRARAKRAKEKSNAD